MTLISPGIRRWRWESADTHRLFAHRRPAKIGTLGVRLVAGLDRLTRLCYLNTKVTLNHAATCSGVRTMMSIRKGATGEH
jgi:hypothetical protein